MITKFKIFEDLEVLPEVGEYVTIEINTFDDDFDIFINNIIFTVVKCWKDSDDFNYEVRLKCADIEIPKKYKIYFFEGNEIIFWASLITEISKSKEKLEQILASKKYNI